MKIVRDYPPNIDAIHALFRTKMKPGVVYCWGNVIFNPMPLGPPDFLPVWIIKHEEVHCKQQHDFGSIDAWWDKYLAEPEFRFKQELPAHQAEYRAFCSATREFNNNKASANKCRDALHQMAKRLSGSLYGNIVSLEQAKVFIGR